MNEMRTKVQRHIRRTKRGRVQVREHRRVYTKWRKLVNMTPAELKQFKATEEGKKAGLSKQQAKELGIKSGQESAEWILKMKPKAKTFDQAEKNWTDKEWEWAKRQNSFNARMIGNKGPLFDDKGRKTRKHTSLLIWGHNPKKNRGASKISQIMDKSSKEELKELTGRPVIIETYGKPWDKDALNFMIANKLKSIKEDNSKPKEDSPPPKFKIGDIVSLKPGAKALEDMTYDELSPAEREYLDKKGRLPKKGGERSTNPTRDQINIDAEYRRQIKDLIKKRLNENDST